MVDYDLAIAINPKHIDAFYQRGLIKLKLSDKAGACNDLSNAITLGNKEAQSAYNENCK